MANHHPRVDILRPGPGVGGHCIAVDPWFIVDAAPRAGAADPPPPGRSTTSMPATHGGADRGHLPRFRRAAVACLGLAFKADVGDTRESPAAEVTRLVAAALPGTPVLTADPFLAAAPAGLASLANLEFTTAVAAVRAAGVVALLVDHPAFGQLTPAQLAGKRLCDTRGMWR